MTYKIICDNCAGNGYLNIKDNKGKQKLNNVGLANPKGK